MPEKVLECQDAMGVVLHEVAAETASQAMGMKFRRQSATIQTGLEIIVGDSALRAT